MTNQTDPTDPTPTPASNPSAAHAVPKRSRRRTLLISGGAVLASAVLIGGGVAVGAAIADESDDEGDTTSDTSQPDDDGTDADDTAVTAASGTASADELLEIIETASAEADGEPVGIEATGADTWQVEFVTSGGEDSDVRVDADGTAAVVSTEPADQDDQAPEGSLDAQTVEALVAAALAHTDGTVVDIEIDGETASPYDVTVLTSDRKTVDIALDSDFKVVTAESDDD